MLPCHVCLLLSSSMVLHWVWERVRYVYFPWHFWLYCAWLLQLSMSTYSSDDVSAGHRTTQACEGHFCDCLFLSSLFISHFARLPIPIRSLELYTAKFVAAFDHKAFFVVHTDWRTLVAGCYVHPVSHLPMQIHLLSRYTRSL